MKTIKNVKTCKNGHPFYKNSDCPICPICEKERKTQIVFFTSIVAPARRALENNGINTLEQLSNYSKKEILLFHGMGKTSIPKLQQLLTDNGLDFKPE